LNVYFCGLIGTGKTTIGIRLAERLGLEFRDLDREMDRRLGYSFHRLVQEEGWLAFRELEYSICRDFAGESNSIICLGGGTVRYDWNVDVLRPSGRLILLNTPLDVLVERVARADRPRVNPGTTLAEDIRMMWEKSSGKYLSAADYVYDTGGKDLEQEVAELAALITTDPLFAGLKTDRKV